MMFCCRSFTQALAIMLIAIVSFVMSVSEAQAQRIVGRGNTINNTTIVQAGGGGAAAQAAVGRGFGGRAGGVQAFAGNGFNGARASVGFGGNHSWGNSFAYNRGFGSGFYGYGNRSFGGYYGGYGATYGGGYSAGFYGYGYGSGGSAYYGASYFPSVYSGASYAYPQTYADPVNYDPPTPLAYAPPVAQTFLYQAPAPMTYAYQLVQVPVTYATYSLPAMGYCR